MVNSAGDSGRFASQKDMNDIYRGKVRVVKPKVPSLKNVSLIERPRQKSIDVSMYHSKKGF